MALQLAYRLLTLPAAVHLENGYCAHPYLVLGTLFIHCKTYRYTQQGITPNVDTNI